MVSARIEMLQLSKGLYRPGERVRMQVQINSQGQLPARARLQLSVVHLAEQVGSLERELDLQTGRQWVDLEYAPPPQAPRGYGLDLSLLTEEGTTLSTYSSAFDVLDNWTQNPRYGFLSEFPPGRGDADETMDLLTHYHLNGLQFYDWMYRHEQFLAEEEPYTDLLGRRLSRQAVNGLIRAAHQRGMAAMPYTAVYGASLAFYQQHPEWALLESDGQPAYFGEDFMVIMDPRPGSPWTAHLLDQFDQLLAQTEFDGLHLDQYGDPKEGYDSSGKPYDLAAALADLIDASRARVLAQRPEGTVVFNAVTNWPIEAVAPAGQDFVYIEVWPPYNWFNDLHDLIVNARSLSGGKPVVLAAYLDPGAVHNVRLVDAVIFASGGGHIELGEGLGMLADPYFPNFELMSSSLAEQVRRLYDLAVRYQGVIGPQVADVTREYGPRLQIEGVSTSLNAMNDKVWPIVRQGPGFLAINLVNLLGLESPEWRQTLSAPPQPLKSVILRLSGVERRPARVWLATPDDLVSGAVALDFQVQDSELILQIPALDYWDLIVIEWSE